MRHYHITRVLYVAMIAMLASTGLVFFAYSQATPAKADDNIDPFISYGAMMVSEAAPLIPNPGCPYYFLMQNLAPTVENPYPEFGLFVIPGSEADAYSNQTLDVPSTVHIGGYIPVPQVACGITPTGGPVFPIYYDAPFFMDGGTLTPSTGD